MRVITLILAMIVLTTGCAFKQFPDQTLIEIERCIEDMRFDPEHERNLPTSRRCTTSRYQGNKEASNVEIKTNPETGEIMFKADAVINAEETDYSKAWGSKIRDIELTLDGLKDLVLDLVPDGQ